MYLRAKKFCSSVFSVIFVISLWGCDLWMNDWKGYLEYWSQTVQVGRLDKSGATFQKNDSGIDTLPVAATPLFEAALINPKGYGLEVTTGTSSGSSVIIDNSSVAGLVGTPSLSDNNSLLSVKLGAGSADLEHQTFTITIAPVRTDNQIAVAGQSITLQYNTPPAAPTRINKADDGTFKVVLVGEQWLPDADGWLYWSWNYTTGGGTEANDIKWFSVDGQRLEIDRCQDSAQTQGQNGVYCYKTGNKNVGLAAVDSEGIASPTIVSGVKVPEGTITDTVKPVTFNPLDGTYFNDSETIYVTLSTDTPDATIQYKVDGGDWHDYADGSTIGMTITQDTTITAKATKPGLLDSNETSATYRVRKLSSIAVSTKPKKTAYNKGETVSFDGMKVTATYNDGTKKEVTGWKVTTDATLTTSKGMNKKVTVSYTEQYTGDAVTKETTLTVDVADYVFSDEIKVEGGGSPSVGSIIEFGYWPQSSRWDGRIKVGDNSVEKGGLTYYVGSDGNYYVKHSGKEYKVEPIKWEVLEVANGTLLLLTKDMLVGGIPYYKDRGDRTIGGKTVKPNNYKYSTIRAWLNGKYESGDTQGTAYTDKGFLQTAFSDVAQGKIQSTAVEAGVNDKVFLLDLTQVTSYFSGDSARIRPLKDYGSKTIGTVSYPGGSDIPTSGWFLRFSGGTGGGSQYVLSSGFVSPSQNKTLDVTDTEMGVVPAIRIAYP